MSSNYQPPSGTPDYGQYNPNQPRPTEPYPGYAPPGQYGAQEQYPQAPYGQYPQAPYGQYPQAPYGQQPDTQMPSQSSRNTATFAHLSVLIGVIATATLLAFVGPLIVYSIAKDKDPFARRAAAAAFNFAVALILGAIAAFLVAAISFYTIITMGIGGIPLFVIIIIAVVCPILGAVRAGKGQDYKYPFSLNILK